MRACAVLGRRDECLLGGTPDIYIYIYIIYYDKGMELENNC